jgi:hypothetical protein
MGSLIAPYRRKVLAKTQKRDPRRVKKSQSKHPNRQVAQPLHHQDRWDVTHHRFGQKIPADRKELQLRKNREEELQRRRLMIQENNAANLAAAQRRRRHINAWLLPLLVLIIGTAAILFANPK